MEHRLLDYTPVAKMLDHDSLEERRRDPRVPDSFRVHDHDRTIAAHAEARRLTPLHAFRTEQESFALQERRQQAVELAAALIW